MQRCRNGAEWKKILLSWGYGNMEGGGGTKLERVLPKNQHTQRKLLNFENWVNGKVSKSAKMFYVKNYLFQFFCSLKNINLGPHFLITSNWTTFVLKMTFNFLRSVWTSVKVKSKNNSYFTDFFADSHLLNSTTV